MKRITLIISMVAIFSLHGFSQRGSSSFGLKIGPAFDWASAGSTAANNEGIRMGYSFGVIVDRYYTQHIAISSGINFIRWRGHYQFTDLRHVGDFLEEVPLSVDRRVRASYLEVPLKVKVKAEVVEGWKAFAEAGVGFSLNLNNETKDEYDYYWVSSDDIVFSNSYSYQYRRLQAALNFGIGAEYQINRKFGVFAQISFNHALTNTFTKEMEERTGSKLQTNFIGLEVGIMR